MASSPFLRRLSPLRHLLSFEVVFALFLFAGVYKASPHLDWTPYDLTATFAALVSLVAVILVLTGRVDFRIESLLLASLLAVFVTYALFSLRWTPGNGYATEKAFRLASVTTLSFLGCAFVVSKARIRLRRFLATTLALALVTAAAALYLLYLHGPVRIEPFNTVYLTTGRMIGFGVVIVGTYLLFSSTSIWRSFVGVSLFVPLLVALSVLDGRGPFAAAIITVGLLVPLALVVTPLRYWPIRLVPVIGAIGSIGALLYYFRDTLRLVEKFESIFAGNTAPSYTNRVDYITAGIDVWLSGNTVVGHGLGSWPAVSGQRAHWPHNIVIELLVELGLVGTVLFFLLILVGLYFTLEGYLTTLEPEYVAVFAILCYTFLNALVTGNFNDNRFLFAAIGLLCYRVHAGTAPPLLSIAEIRSRTTQFSNSD
ncbi:O-antigen ligase family protein [Saliphagus infecundisoli]|uniref:O-antigen ligase family protein n=1 Tax=Saliphagus infecundisoli TaxID=1849069 RepID=A0ABD5QJ92_9EURY|nr:O-antigen ligase family protein [Saliphagus infecundisoli]